VWFSSFNKEIGFGLDLVSQILGGSIFCFSQFGWFIVAIRPG
jgi:hypothetical protein